MFRKGEGIQYDKYLTNNKRINRYKKINVKINYEHCNYNQKTLKYIYILLCSLRKPQQMIQNLYKLSSIRMLTSPFMFYFSNQNVQLKLPISNNQRPENTFKRTDQTEDLLTPQKVVQYLDKYVIGQAQAKKAVAISFRNRWRRKNLPEELRHEITPKNLLIKGPTGSGKSEIARRLAKLTDAPFLRVEATKYTQVGYVGKDVSTIIEDLAKVGLNSYKKKHEKYIKESLEVIKNEIYIQILDSMLGSDWRDKEVWKQKLQSLKSGHFDNHLITLLPGWHSQTLSALGLQPPFPPQKPLTKTVKQIFSIFYSIYNQKLKYVTNVDFNKQAVKLVEQEGIVFLDQIDKLAIPQGTINTGKGVSTDGVQRDLLPIIEGTSVNTKFGQIKTDHILFIASGSFSMAKVQDLMPELLGRLPIRVSLQPISLEQFVRILTETEYNLLMQQVNLLKTQNVELVFEHDAVKQIAEYAFQMNQNTENLGARRLQQIVQKVIEDISFNACQRKGQKITITKEYVTEKVQSLNTKMNLTKYLI